MGHVPVRKVLVYRRVPLKNFLLLLSWLWLWLLLLLLLLFISYHLYHFRTTFQWIGLRENLQETIDFPIKYGAFL